MKIVTTTTLFALLLLTSCGGGSGSSAPEVTTKKTQTVVSQQVSYVAQLKTLERAIISRLLEAQDLYVSTEINLDRSEKIELIKLFKQDQEDLKLVETEMKRALELEKIQKMSYQDVLAQFGDRMDDIIVVQDSSIDLVDLHQEVLSQGPILDQLIAQKSLSSLANADIPSNELIVYQSGPFIYLQ